MTKTERSLLSRNVQFTRGRQRLHKEQMNSGGCCQRGRAGHVTGTGRGVWPVVREGSEEVTSEALQRSGQSDPGFGTASAKVLRLPELVNRGRRRHVEAGSRFSRKPG